jgi:DNA mismatch repair ATPase MutL
MEELLPILIGIAWFAYKMYQGAQKKAANKAAKSRPQPQSYEEPADKSEEDISLEDFMAKFYGKEEEVVEEPIPQNYERAQSNNSVENDYATVEDYSNLNYQSVEEGYEENEAIPQYKSVENDTQSLHEKLQSIQHTNSDEINEDLNEIIPFDARKAIIYDAIINRPYA